MSAKIFPRVWIHAVCVCARARAGMREGRFIGRDAETTTFDVAAVASRGETETIDQKFSEKRKKGKRERDGAFVMVSLKSAPGRES